MIIPVEGKVTEIEEPSGYGSGAVTYRDIDGGKLQTALGLLPIGRKVRILIKEVDE